jgi:hypothetical protein
MGDQLTVAAGLLGARLQKDIGDFLNVANAQSPDKANNIVEATTVVVEELARLLACLDNATQRYACQLQLLQQLPAAVEGIREQIVRRRVIAAGPGHVGG